MTFTIRLSHVSAFLAVTALVIAFNAAGGTPPSSAPEVMCVTMEAAGITVLGARTHTLDRPGGWGAYITKQNAQGWVPTHFLGGDEIGSVCFRRDRIPGSPSEAPLTNDPPRCGPKEQEEMRRSGMSESAIKSACGTK